MRSGCIPRLAALLAVVLLLASCGQARPKDDALRILCHRWIYEKLDLPAAIEGYEAAHPEKRVEVVVYDNYEHLLNPLENKENLIMFDMFLGLSREHIVEKARAEELLSFESGFFDSDLRRDDFFPSFIELGVIDGRQYMIPILGEVLAVVVREDLFREAGLTNADGSLRELENWEQLTEFAKTLHDPEKNITGIAIDYGPNLMLYNFFACLQAYQGTIFDRETFQLDIGGEGPRYILEQWAGLVEQGLCETEVLDDVDAAREAFKAGKVAMFVTPHSRWQEIANTLGEDKVALMPLPGAEQHGSLTYIHGAVVSSHSANKDDAIAFLKEQLLSRRSQAACMERFGKIPSIVRNYDKSIAPEWSRVFDWIRNSATLPLDANWNKKDAAFYEQTALCLRGGQSASRTIDSIAAAFAALEKGGAS